MDKKQIEALFHFMMLTLERLHPNHLEYSFDEIRAIEETEGYDSDKFSEYPEYVMSAYWMKRDIEIVSQGRVRYSDYKVDISD